MLFEKEYMKYFKLNQWKTHLFLVARIRIENRSRNTEYRETGETMEQDKFKGPNDCDAKTQRRNDSWNPTPWKQCNRVMLMTSPELRKPYGHRPMHDN
jgi:hypothetical protein